MKSTGEAGYKTLLVVVYKTSFFGDFEQGLITSLPCKLIMRVMKMISTLYSVECISQDTDSKKLFDQKFSNY